MSIYKRAFLLACSAQFRSYERVARAVGHYEDAVFWQRKADDIDQCLGDDL